MKEQQDQSKIVQLPAQAIAKARAGGGFGSVADPYDEEDEEESSSSSLDLEQVPRNEIKHLLKKKLNPDTFHLNDPDNLNALTI